MDKIRMGARIRPPAEKPPIGLIPKFIRDHERQVEILEAINRYISANKAIPIEWVQEYNELCPK